MALTYDLLNAHPPITNHIGFVSSDLDTVVHYCNKWMIPQAYSKPEFFQSEIDTAIGRLLPMTGWQLLLIQCQNNWTALLEDRDDIPPVGIVSKELSCRGVVSTYIPQTISDDMIEGSWGAIQLRVFEDHPTECQNVGRTLSLTNNCGVWRFDVSGEPLPYEDEDRYRARRVKDRFTLDMLLGILDQFGIGAYNKEFYTEKCALYHPPAHTYTGTELRIDGRIVPPSTR